MSRRLFLEIKTDKLIHLVHCSHNSEISTTALPCSTCGQLEVTVAGGQGSPLGQHAERDQAMEIR